MNKQSRQFAIKQIITHQAIGSQEELCNALLKANFEVTQATLSRDLKELGIARVNTPEGIRYILHTESEERRLTPFIGYEIEDMYANESLVVVKTLPGRAQGVAEIIDSLHHPLILGTLAGDNTIFVTPASVGKIGEVLNLLRGLMTEKKNRVA
ncbi:MAG: arginine repressor [Ignavibacteriales bacterium]|nr:arginine repressor [Ignavibacteriales bacterium]